MTSDIVEIGGCCAGVPARLADILDTWHVTFGPTGFESAKKTLQLGSAREYEILNRAQYLRAFLTVIEPYDMLHLHCRTYLPLFADLPIWRALGKQVWISFHGSDIRGKQRKAANPLLRLADRVFVSTPDLLDTLPDAEWLPNPAPAQLPPAPTAGEDLPLVVHCPSRRATKGSGQIVEAVSILRHCGERFEFRLLENQPHDAVLQQIRGADIVIDQAVIGMYGMVAIEAMAARKPVLAYLNGAQDRLPEGCPVVNCGRAPSEIASALSACLEHQTLRDRLGHQGEEYVTRVHGTDNIRRILS